MIALTSCSERHRIIGTFDAGAVGYLFNDAAPEDIINAVRNAADCWSPVDPRVALVLLDSGHRTSRPAFGLTARRHEVLRLLSEGCANRHIARRLGISETIVEAHLTSVFKTNGVDQPHASGALGTPTRHSRRERRVRLTNPGRCT